MGPDGWSVSAPGGWIAGDPGQGEDTSAPQFQAMGMAPGVGLIPLVVLQAGDASLSPSTMIAGAMAMTAGYFLRFRKRR
jgi:LPXTG-motif cell wall-anchored protein